MLSMRHTTTHSEDMVDQKVKQNCNPDALNDSTDPLPKRKEPPKEGPKEEISICACVSNPESAEQFPVPWLDNKLHFQTVETAILGRSSMTRACWA